METVLEFDNVSKHYGKVQALNEVSVKVLPGEKVAILGSNGAGKTTFLSLSSGLIRPSLGEIQVLGQKPGKISVRERQTYLPQTLGFPENLKVAEVLTLVSAHYVETNCKVLMHELGLEKLKQRKTYQLSGGQKRKLGLACALLGNPKFAMLDEPTANIDVEGRKHIREMLNSLFSTNDKTLLFSSHEMHEVETLADRIVVLGQGKIIADGNARKIKEQFGLKKVSFYSRKDIRLNFSNSLEKKGELYEVLSNDSDRVIKEALKQDTELSKISIDLPNLEEVLQKLWRADESYP